MKKSPWGSLNKADKKRIKQIASSGMVGGKAKKLRLPK